MEKNDPFISRQIDLNLNLGEGFGEIISERELLNYATSVNISTGAHAGDAGHIDRCFSLCKDHDDLSVGALISYPDIVGYGLRKIQLSPEDLRASIIAQLGAITALAKAHNYEINHVRPHGYLYQQISTNYSVAEVVAKAIQEISSWMILIGPHSPVLEEISSWTNIRVAYEGRYDLRYKADSQLINFDLDKDANLDLETAAERARDLVYKSVAKLEDGSEVDVKFDTLHLASKVPNAQEICKVIKGMILKPMPLKSINYEPYLSEFI